mmetsp:Transcript_12126/g.21625  ORF Transcript_12126/g.21625 Transcript_12126/m.21625 type:complete len:252 (+) Transcript_12126:165-920(+)
MGIPAPIFVKLFKVVFAFLVHSPFLFECLSLLLFVVLGVKPRISFFCRFRRASKPLWIILIHISDAFREKLLLAWVPAHKTFEVFLYCSFQFKFQKLATQVSLSRVRFSRQTFLFVLFTDKLGLYQLIYAHLQLSRIGCEPLLSSESILHSSHFIDGLQRTLGTVETISSHPFRNTRSLLARSHNSFGSLQCSFLLTSVFTSLFPPILVSVSGPRRCRSLSLLSTATISSSLGASRAFTAHATHTGRRSLC